MTTSTPAAIIAQQLYISCSLGALPAAAAAAMMQHARRSGGGGGALAAAGLLLCASLAAAQDMRNGITDLEEYICPKVTATSPPAPPPACPLRVTAQFARPAKLNKVSMLVASGGAARDPMQRHAVQGLLRAPPNSAGPAVPRRGRDRGLIRRVHLLQHDSREGILRATY